MIADFLHLNDDYLTDIHLQNQNENFLTQAVSSIDWSLKYPDCFACTLWDGTVKIYQLALKPFSQRTSTSDTHICQLASFQASKPFPATSCAWNDDGTVLFFGTSHGQVSALDPNTGQIVNFGTHAASINYLKYLPQYHNTLLSTAYEGNVHIWDLKSPKPVQTFCFSKKIYKASCSRNTLVTGMADEKIGITNLRSSHVRSEVESILGQGSQIQSLSVRQDGQAVGFGSIDGRANMSFIQSKPQMQYELKSHIVFKAHKSEQQNEKLIFYPINTVEFHKSEPCLSTCGSDGIINFWNYIDKIKSKTLSYSPIPVCCTKSSPNGNFMAYALGNDWHTGVEGEKHQWKPKIAVHRLKRNNS